MLAKLTHKAHRSQTTVTLARRRRLHLQTGNRNICTTPCCSEAPTTVKAYPQTVATRRSSAAGKSTAWLASVSFFIVVVVVVVVWLPKKLLIKKKTKKKSKDVAAATNDTTIFINVGKPTTNVHTLALETAAGLYWHLQHNRVTSNQARKQTAQLIELKKKKKKISDLSNDDYHQPPSPNFLPRGTHLTN